MTHNEEKHVVEINSKKSYVSYLKDKDFKVTLINMFQGLKGKCHINDIGNLSHLRKTIKKWKFRNWNMMKGSLNGLNNRLNCQKKESINFKRDQ